MMPVHEGVKEIQSPSGLDLNPQPRSSVRLSKRAGILGFGVVFAVVAAVGYGIVTRSRRSIESGFQPAEAKLTAATDAGKVIAAQIPTSARTTGGAADSAPVQQEELRPPGQAPSRSLSDVPGQRMYSVAPYSPPAVAPQYREPTAEEKRLVMAYERELQALDSPTNPQATTGAGLGRFAVANASSPDTGNMQLGNLLRSLQGAPLATAGTSVPSDNLLPKITFTGQTNSAAEEYDAQNMQSSKERFLARGRAASEDKYQNSTRTKPFGPYEIKAGWDIPAVLEQALNSDLPGEIKALVRENVYDTATGKYLLIPQGARLVGAYDSRVAYGQNGIQVVWNRLIFPDGSSINLEGMTGQDASGLSGLRHDVDNHYKRLIGFGLLTSVFSASFQLSQTRRDTVLGYPSPAETAGSAVGAQVSQLGADVTRRNLNIQPTIKVPVGYRFNVRLNRDILFEAPYQPSAGRLGPAR
jgi:type IV secretion system protein VirB10